MKRLISIICIVSLLFTTLTSTVFAVDNQANVDKSILKGDKKEVVTHNDITYLFKRTKKYNIVTSIFKDGNTKTYKLYHDNPEKIYVKEINLKDKTIKERLNTKNMDSFLNDLIEKNDKKYTEYSLKELGIIKKEKEPIKINTMIPVDPYDDGNTNTYYRDKYITDHFGSEYISKVIGTKTYAGYYGKCEEEHSLNIIEDYDYEFLAETTIASIAIYTGWGVSNLVGALSSIITIWNTGEEILAEGVFWKKTILREINNRYAVVEGIDVTHKGRTLDFELGTFSSKESSLVRDQNLIEQIASIFDIDLGTHAGFYDIEGIIIEGIERYIAYY